MLRGTTLITKQLFRISVIRNVDEASRLDSRAAQKWRAILPCRGAFTVPLSLWAAAYRLISSWPLHQ